MANMDNATGFMVTATEPTLLCPLRFGDVAAKPDDLLSSIQPLLKVLRPAWKLDGLVTEELVGGAINHMVCVYHEGDEWRDDAMVVRVHGINLSGQYEFRTSDIFGMQLAHHANCFPPIYAIFRNGVMYKYIPGKTMSRLEFIDPESIYHLMWKLYRLHHVDAKSVAIVQQGERDLPDGVPVKHQVEDILPGDAFARAVEFFISLIPDKANDPDRDVLLQPILDEFPREKLREECDYLRSYLNDLPIPMCFSHADFHPGNIVFSSRSKEPFFVDYEGAGMHNEYHDLSYLFCCVPFHEHNGFGASGDMSPEKRVRHEYLRCYRDAGYRFHGKDPSEIPEIQCDLDLELLTVGHTITGICMEFYFMTHHVGLVNVLEKLNCVPYFPYRKTSYNEGREKLPALAEEYKKLVVECGVGTIADTWYSMRVIPALLALCGESTNLMHVSDR